MNEFVWPDFQALMDDFAEYFEEIEQVLQVRSMDDLQAGSDRARTALDNMPETDAAMVAALIFDGVVTRHALVDGNKRLAWQSMTTFLDLNDIWFDAPEREAFDAAIATVTGEMKPEGLAAFIRKYTAR